MIVLVDEIDAVVTDMRNLSASDAAKFGITAGLESPYYIYGTRIDINKELVKKDKNPVEKDKKYPLIALRLDSPEEIVGDVVKYNLNIAILATTSKNYNAEQRYTYVIKPVLLPLYELLMDRLHKHKFFWPGDQSYPPHTKIDRPYWGIEGSEGNASYIFSDPLDAIEIVNLKLSKRANICD